MLQPFGIDMFLLRPPQEESVHPIDRRLPVFPSSQTIDEKILDRDYTDTLPFERKDIFDFHQYNLKVVIGFCQAPGPPAQLEVAGCRPET